MSFSMTMCPFELSWNIWYMYFPYSQLKYITLLRSTPHILILYMLQATQIKKRICKESSRHQVLILTTTDISTYYIIFIHSVHSMR